MRRVLVVGVGAGDPDQITVQAVRALNEADVLFELERGTEDLTRAREALCARHLAPGRPPAVVAVREPVRDRSAPDYERAVADWRRGRAQAWEEAIEHDLAPDGTGAFLVWGDPSLYDSTIAVLDEILAAGRIELAYEVLPGISSLHALTARHRISLNRVGRAVMITTGRRLAERGLPADADDVVVMLDAGCAFRHVAGEPLDIYWGAYLGTADEILLSGPLGEVAGEIERVRAQARAEKGWIMDLYLLRRRLT
ncbi:MAG: precorrin-6A synthase (deacetylating) [Solirubrobacteraceae bacterium]